jgi:hypothetical protein
VSTPGRPPGRVPTLTEVVRLPDASAHAAGREEIAEDGSLAWVPTMPTPLASTPAPFVERRSPAPAPVEDVDEERIVERVLADVQRQIDLMLEVRLREVLAPVLTRATDALAREARAELASTLRDVVARAVAQEIARHRGR